MHRPGEVLLLWREEVLLLILWTGTEETGAFNDILQRLQLGQLFMVRPSSNLATKEVATERL